MNLATSKKEGVGQIRQHLNPQPVSQFFGDSRAAASPAPSTASPTSSTASPACPETSCCACVPRAATSTACTQAFLTQESSLTSFQTCFCISQATASLAPSPATRVHLPGSRSPPFHHVDATNTCFSCNITSRGGGLLYVLVYHTSAHPR